MEQLKSVWIALTVAGLIGCSSIDSEDQSSAVAAVEDKPPNVILFLADDLGWRDVGFMGSEFYETPHLDQLAQQGLVFTQAYASHPVCSPTRAALLTGRDPARLRITDFIPDTSKPKRHSEPKNARLRTPQIETELPLSEVTLAERFKEAGYRTLLSGKWHLGEEQGFWPEYQGFDENFGGWSRGAPKAGYFSPYENPRLSDGSDGEHLTDRLATETIQFLSRTDDQPFFIYHSFYAVHMPVQAVPAFVGAYEEKQVDQEARDLTQSNDRYETRSRVMQSDPAYGSMVSAMDAAVGRILSAVERKGLSDNTIIVFASDNGGLSTGPVARRILPTSNLPLRAGKGWLYEGGIRIPLIIKVPEHETLRSSDEPVTTTDLFPTLLSLAGLSNPSSIELDGLDLSPVLRGENLQGQRTLVWHYPHYHGSGWRPGTSVRSGPWKLIHHYETDEVELFNLDEDPGETTNIARQNPTIVSQLRREISDWKIRTDALLPTSIENAE